MNKKEVVEFTIFEKWKVCDGSKNEKFASLRIFETNADDVAQIIARCIYFKLIRYYWYPVSNNGLITYTWSESLICMYVGPVGAYTQEIVPTSMVWREMYSLE